MNRLQQLQTHNVSTDDRENTNDTNQGADSSFVYEPGTVPRGTGKMPQGNKRNWRSIMHYTNFINRKKNQPPNVHGRPQIVSPKWKRSGNPNIGSEDIKWDKDGISRAMRHVNNEKRKTTYDGKNRTTKSTKNQNSRRTRKLQVLWNIWTGHYQICRDER